MRDNEVILIIGVGRSGTSALTRVLSLCGCALPQRLVGAMEINQKGSWEPVDIWKMNHKFMMQHGTQYTDPTLRLQEAQLDAHESEEYIRSVQTCLVERSDEPGPLLIKQPDITEFMELWIEAARRVSVKLKVIIPIRHPSEVFSSMASAHWLKSIELSNSFWLKRNLLAERHSRNLPRLFVDYANLMSDWRNEVGRVSRILSINLDPNEVAIDQFLTSDLHRNKHSSSIVESFGCSWLTRVHATLSSAARDMPLDIETLDDIYHSYRMNERTFRVAWDEFRNKIDSVDTNKFQEFLDKAPTLHANRDF